VTDPAWLEATVVVAEEYAEAVADAFARYAPGGVALTYLLVQPDPDGEGRPGGPVEVRAYLRHDAGLEERRARLTEALWHLGQIAEIPEPVFQPVVDEDWSRSWRKRYRPLRLGKRIHILPSWYRAKTRRGDIVLRLDPGMAFGTGTHPTTQLCLEALEDLVIPGMRVIDLGCGSGILAVAAAKLGAARVLGTDIDKEAIRVADENVRRNRMTARVTLAEGSLADLLAAGETADLVAANILAIVLRKMLGENLAGLLAPGGRIILSGILQEQSADVERALIEAGLRLDEKRRREDWVALVASRE
jgi:ribosomal protein L11 methyltransferase